MDAERNDQTANVKKKRLIPIVCNSVQYMSSLLSIAYLCTVRSVWVYPQSAAYILMNTSVKSDVGIGILVVDFQNSLQLK